MLQTLNMVASAFSAGLCLLAAAVLASAIPPWQGRARGLAVFMFVNGIGSLHQVMLDSGAHRHAPHLIGLAWPLLMLQGPAIYAYVRAMTDPAPAPRSLRSLVLFGWPLLLGALLITPFCLLDGPSKIAFMERGEAALLSTHDLPAMAVLVTLLGIFGVALAYLLAAFRLLVRHMRRVRDLFSNMENKSLSWVRWALLILSATWVWGAAGSGSAMLGVSPAWQKAVALALELGWLGVLAFYGIKQFPVFEEQRPEQSSAARYSRSALDAQRMDRIAEKLVQAMREQRLFADASLSLRGLSDHTAVSENYISQTLNDRLGVNFFDFVNAARIEEARRLLIERGRTVLDVAMAVGFNSRSTFNAAFRKHAGMTPSAFRAAH
jgi:AraC-like DNA-binding protein